MRMRKKGNGLTTNQMWYDVTTAAVVDVFGNKVSQVFFFVIKKRVK